MRSGAHRSTKGEPREASGNGNLDHVMFNVHTGSFARAAQVVVRAHEALVSRANDWCHVAPITDDARMRHGIPFRLTCVLSTPCKTK